MGRVSKPKLEGDAWGDKLNDNVIEVVDRVLADPVPGDNGAALERIAAYFRASHPEDWEMLRLCPLQHGLIDMIEKLKG